MKFAQDVSGALLVLSTPSATLGASCDVLRLLLNILGTCWKALSITRASGHILCSMVNVSCYFGDNPTHSAIRCKLLQVTYLPDSLVGIFTAPIINKKG